MKTHNQQQKVIGKSKPKKLTAEQRSAMIDVACKLVFISLFAGCGGSSKGYHMANLKELLAIEWEKNARESFKANFPKVPIEGWDIGRLTREMILKKIGLRIGELDIFDASPPCQDISTANNNRSSEGERNLLYLKSIALIGEIQPKVFIIENVSGLIKGKMKSFFNQVVDELNKLNYYCEYKVVRGNEHGVPQARERCYIIGVRNDIVEKFGMLPLFPEPDMGTAKHMGVCDALPYLKWYSPGQFKDQISPSTKPMCTITKTASAWVYEADGIRRKPTIKELKVLSSFPEDFILTGSFNQQWARIGNAVPPNMAKAIGENVRDRILTEKVLAYSKTEAALKYAMRMATNPIPLNKPTSEDGEFRIAA